MVKTSTSYSPKVRPMNSKTINRSGSSTHDNRTTTSTSFAPMYSKSVDTKYHSRPFDYTNSTKLSPRRDNSAVLRAVSASASASNTVCFATASRLSKYRLQQQQLQQHHQPAYKSHEMFEQQTQSQPEAKPNTFGKYECEPFSKSNGGGAGVANIASSADDCKNNQMVVITLNGTNGAASAQQKQVNKNEEKTQEEHKL